MKTFGLAQVAVVGTVFGAAVSAIPLHRRAGSADTENGWESILNKQNGTKCSDLAVIFARGTFETGNIGAWVGAPFRDALNSKNISVTFQGVSPDDYPATLAGYVEEGGPQSCADSMANSVKAYAEACPNADIVLSGWSQGALCARKSFSSLGDASKKVSALVTFGDPIYRFKDDDEIKYPSIPENTEQITFCNSSPTDPLCGDGNKDNLPNDVKGVLNYVGNFAGNFADSFNVSKMSDAQKSSLKQIERELPKQFAEEAGHLASDIAHGNGMRWLVTPQHFFYSSNGDIAKAADKLLSH